MPQSLAAALALAALTAIWIAIVLYSRHRYYLEGCAACGGTG